MERRTEVGKTSKPKPQRAWTTSEIALLRELAAKHRYGKKVKVMEVWKRMSYRSYYSVQTKIAYERSSGGVV